MVDFDPLWKPLVEALDRGHREGKRPQFWLRDDDAVEPTPELDRLLSLCGGSNVPVVLAVIPQPTGKALAKHLEATDACIAVHGWAHQNHAEATEKKQELGSHREPDVVLGQLQEGLAKLVALHGSRAIPMLVPPWNRINSNLIPQLGDIGFEALSTFGPPKPAPIRIVNSNVDLIDWHGTRGCVDHAVLIGLISAQLRRSEPVGILGHHLVHDEAVWEFLEKLFALTHSFDVEWLCGCQLLKYPA